MFKTLIDIQSSLFLNMGLPMNNCAMIRSLQRDVKQSLCYSHI